MYMLRPGYKNPENLPNFQSGININLILEKDVFLVLSQAKDKERIRFAMKITIFLVSFTMSSSNVTIFSIVFTYCLYKNARHSSHMNLNDSDLAYHDAVNRRIHKSEGRLL